MSGFPKPTDGTTIKMASIVVHADEATSGDGHHFDFAAMRALVDDPEVQAYLAELRPLALLPEKRNP